MAGRDFFQNNQTARQPVNQTSQEQKPQNAKEMYTQQAAQEKANAKPMQQLSEPQKQKVDEIKARLEKATQHRSGNAPAQPAAPGDATTSPQPMRQNMMSQDKAAPALTPTSAQAGTTAPETTRAQTPQTENAKAFPQPAQRPQTVPRPRPSWER